MTELKLQHILTLSFLLSKGARHNYIPITTSELGKNIQKSQQAASKHLLELEEDDFIERIISGRILSVKITEKGYSEMIHLSNVLNTSLNAAPAEVVLKGVIVSGMGEGAYYMSLKGYAKQFKEKIGYTPYPGTLNVKLGKKQFTEAITQFDEVGGTKISGFSDGKRTYGWVKCFGGKIDGKIDCQLIRLERTHHDKSIVELIARDNIRKKGNYSDGSKIVIIIPLNNK